MFKFVSRPYLVFEVYSSYLEVEKLEDNHYFDKPKTLFSRHGKPLVVSSGYGNSFSSQKHNFEHETSKIHVMQRFSREGTSDYKVVFKKTNFAGEGKWLGLKL